MIWWMGCFSGNLALFMKVNKKIVHGNFGTFYNIIISFNIPEIFFLNNITEIFNYLLE